jgi:hypothetical protein
MKWIIIAIVVWWLLEQQPEEPAQDPIAFEGDCDLSVFPPGTLVPISCHRAL